MTSVSLNAALSGLQVAQQAIDTISTNVANASTPGYTRKILPQETQVIDGQGVGVISDHLSRVVNTSLIADVNRQSSVAGYASVQQTYFQQIQDFQGAPNAGTALSDQVTQLSNTFAQLSQSPSDPTLLSQTLTAAQQLTSQLNKFSNLLTGLRSQTETDISAAVSTVNNDLTTIAQLNVQISTLSSEGQNIADLQDQRDSAIADVSKYMQITTSTTNNITTVATQQGQVLADASARTVYFTQSTMLPGSYYPGGGLSGLTIGSPTGQDITSGIGGQLGGLFSLRDQTLPQYNAQLDEFSQKLASRFQSEGLTLFTDGNGNVPANVPDPGIPGYVGFAALIQVNPAVLNNPNLIQQGTTGQPQLSGSNEVINRIAQYAFGNFQYQQATGTVDIKAGDIGAIEPALGLTTNNNVTGTVNIATYADFSTLPGASLPGTFNITLGALPVQTITVTPADTAASLVSKINTAFGSSVASLNSQGELALNYKGDITLTDGGVGLPAFGLTAGTTTMPDPSFQVRVGTQNPVTVTIAPTDTSVNLLAQLNAIPGLTASLDASGHLVMVPTNGGSLTATDIAGAPLAAMGVTISNVAFPAFRQQHLGPDGTLSTGLLANSTLQNYMSSSIADQSEAANINQAQSTQETAYFNTLQQRNTNTSGVNIDQEMTNLIQAQSAYAASAKVITATKDIFDALLAAFPSG